MVVRQCILLNSERNFSLHKLSLTKKRTTNLGSVWLYIYLFSFVWLLLLSFCQDSFFYPIRCFLLFFCPLDLNEVRDERKKKKLQKQIPVAEHFLLILFLLIQAIRLPYRLLYISFHPVVSIYCKYVCVCVCIAFAFSSDGGQQEERTQALVQILIPQFFLFFSFSFFISFFFFSNSFWTIYSL